MPTEKKVQASAGATDRLLWVGVLGPPVIWAVHMELCYLLVPRVCRWWGSSWLLHLLTLVSLLLIAGGALAAWRGLERAKREPEASEENTRTERALFMARFGLVLSAFMFLVTLSQDLPSFLLKPCE